MSAPKCVAIQNGCFEPAELTVTGGDWVHFENKDTEPHELEFHAFKDAPDAPVDPNDKDAPKPKAPDKVKTPDPVQGTVWSDRPAGPDLGDPHASLRIKQVVQAIQPGGTFDRMFSVPGTYEYRCPGQEDMKGTIVVSRA